MRVNLGPYKNWVGPYQLVELLKYVGVSEYLRDKIAILIPTAPFLWLEKMRGERKEKIVIHNYDAWSADHTLAKIIAPLLHKVKEDKHGVPCEFLGKEYSDLVSSNEFWAEKGDGPLHDHADVLFKQAEDEWNKALDHMIWAFEEYNKDNWDDPYWTGERGECESIASGETHWNPITKKDEQLFELKSTGTRECDWEGRQKHWDRMQEGINLFAKHFSSLWT